MAGGSFGQQAAAAKEFSSALGTVQESASSLVSVIGALKVALLSLAGPIATKRELELTAQAFYKLRLQMTATESGARQYVSTVKSVTSANVLARRELVNLYGELRKAPGLFNTTNKELAELTVRLQKEFPQAASQAGKALSEMAEDSPEFQQMMSKNTSAINAFALANAKFGSEYAQVIAAARGDLGDFTNQQQTLLQSFAETTASIEDFAQNASEAFKAPVLGVLSLIETLAKLGNILTSGEFGKAFAPLAASFGVFAGMKSLRGGMLGRMAGTAEKAGQSLLGNLGTMANPLFVRVVGQIPVGGESLRATGAGGGPLLMLTPDEITKRGQKPTLRQRAQAGWSKMGGLGGVAMAAVGGAMIGSTYEGTYESAMQEGKGIGWGSAAGSATTGAFGGMMLGSVFGAKGGPVGALIGAIIGLTAAMVASRQATLDLADQWGMEAYGRTKKAENELLAAQQMEREIRERGGGTISGERVVRRDLLAAEISEYPALIESAKTAQYEADQKISDLHTLMLEWDTAKNSPDTTAEEFERLHEKSKRLGIEADWSTFFPEDEYLEKITELRKKSADEYQKQIEYQEKAIVASEELKNLTYKDLVLTNSRISVLAAQAALMERQLTLGAGPNSVVAIRGILEATARETEGAIGTQQSTIANRLGAVGGANVGALLAGRSQGQMGGLFRALGTMKEADFYKAAASTLGIDENAPALRELYRTYEQIADEIGPQINDLEKMRLDLINQQLAARTFEIDTNMKLLDIDQQRMDTMKGIADALKMPTIVQAQLTAQQIRATQEQIRLEEKRLDEMRQLNLSHVEIYEQTAKIDSLYGRLAGQVDYIRRSWEEVFTQASLNMPGGSYIMPTMTGLMEQGPAFMPYAASQMKDGKLAGFGTYESIMGFGKASAFSQLQQHLESAVQGSADSINYFSNELAATGAAMGALRERIEDIAANGYGRAAGD